MKKFKKVWQNQILKNSCLLFIQFFILEILFRKISGINLWNYSLLRIFLGTLILAIFFGYLVSFLPKLGVKIMNLFISLFASIYGIFQLGFYNYFGVYASIQTKSQLGAVTSYIKDFLKSFHMSYYLLIIPFILFLLYYIFLDKRISKDLPKRKINKKVVALKCIPIGIIFLLYGCFYLTMNLGFMQNKLQSQKTYEIFKKPTTPSIAIYDFGYIGYGLLDVKEMFFPGRENMNIRFNAEELKNKELEPEEQVTISNDIWIKIIEEEKDNNFNLLNKYFIHNDVGHENEYTGKLKDKNVIVIMIESANDILFNETLYPNMAKLYKEGYSWENNYSPINMCNTMNNEFSGMTSIYSINNNCTANVYKNNTYFQSIFNLFNEAGYLTSSYHDHYDEFYDRTTIHAKMGSGAFYKAEDLQLPSTYPNGDWSDDREFMLKYLEMLDERDISKPFMNWLTTVSSHHPYDHTSKFSKIYWDITPENYSDALKSYMSKLKVVDDAIGILLDGLEERDLLKDTVIVLYGDHYPYAMETDEIQPALSYDLEEGNNREQVPLIIYSQDLGSKTFTDYTSYINILPTIANLFGLSYDSRLMMGYDLLSEDYESIIYFEDGSWKNEIAFYDASKGKISYYQEDKKYSDEEILAINEKVALKLNMSSLAIRTNYFSYLSKKIEENKPPQEDIQNN